MRFTTRKWFWLQAPIQSFKARSMNALERYVLPRITIWAEIPHRGKFIISGAIQQPVEAIQ